MVSKGDSARLIYLYARSAEEKEHFEKLAEEAGSPTVSKFILNLVETALSEEKPPTPPEDLRAEVKRLNEELRVKTALLERYEQDLRKLQATPFLDEGFQGSRAIDAELVRILKKGPLNDFKLLDAMGIDPKDRDLTRALGKQLEIMEAYGLITKSPRGWIWIL